MKLLIKSPAHFLLFLFIPVSTGNFIFFREDIGILSFQQIFTLILYSFAFILFVAGRLTTRWHWTISLFFLYAFLTGSIYNFNITSFWLKLFSLAGVLITATIIVKRCEFKDFCKICYISLLCTFILSISFSLIFPEISYTDHTDYYALSSFYDQKNAYGRMLYLLVFFILIVTAWRKGKFLNPITIASLLAVLYTLSLSNSRTSFALAGIILTLFVLFKNSTTLNKLMTPAAFITLTIIMTVLVFIFGSFQNIGSNFDYFSIAGIELSLTGRATIWSNIFQALSNEGKWLFGFGIEGFFKTYYSHYIVGIGLGNFIPNDSHNGYVDLILTFGIIGSIIYAYIIASYLKNVSLIKNVTARSTLSIFLLIYLIANFTESYFVKTSNIMSFLFFCFYLYSIRMTNNNEQS